MEIGTAEETREAFALKAALDYLCDEAERLGLELPAALIGAASLGIAEHIANGASLGTAEGQQEHAATKEPCKTGAPARNRANGRDNPRVSK